jgi:hypothetical protein
MAIRERVNNALSPIEGLVKDDHFVRLREADDEFLAWYTTWDQAFSQKYDDVGKFDYVLKIRNPSKIIHHSILSTKFTDSASPCGTFPQGDRFEGYKWPG